MVISYFAFNSMQWPAFCNCSNIFNIFAQKKSNNNIQANNINVFFLFRFLWMWILLIWKLKSKVNQLHGGLFYFVSWVLSSLLVFSSLFSTRYVSVTFCDRKNVHSFQMAFLKLKILIFLLYFTTGLKGRTGSLYIFHDKCIYFTVFWFGYPV